MSKSISMSITDEAFELWEQYKKDVKMTQGDAMTKLITDALKSSIPERLRRKT